MPARRDTLLQPIRHRVYWAFVNTGGLLSRLTVEARRRRNDALRFRPAPVRVAMTTYPARATAAAAAIESVLNGQVRTPRAITLVLSEDEFPGRRLPPALSSLKGIEILWASTNMRSYNKLVPVLEAYPDEIIVTVDDDLLYPPWWLARLLGAHRRHPTAVVAYRAWSVTTVGTCLAPYESWGKASRKAYGSNVFPTGVGGVLYPPHSLDELAVDWALAERLAPGTDDIWFWAMRVLAGTPAVSLTGRFTDFKPVGPPSSGALHLENCSGGRNDRNLQQICEYFSLGRALVDGSG